MRTAFQVGFLVAVLVNTVVMFLLLTTDGVLDPKSPKGRAFRRTFRPVLFAAISVGLVCAVGWLAAPTG